MLNESPARPKRHEKDGDQQPNLLKSLAHRRGFEPRTSRFVVWCSIQLSYRCLLRASGLKAVPARWRRGNVTTSENDRAPRRPPVIVPETCL